MKEINLLNVGKNLQAIRESGRKVIGVVKNNAYGCGALEVSRYLVNQGVDILFVNEIKEAIPLLENNITTKILVHNSLSVNDYSWLYKYNNLAITINSIDDCLSVNNYCHIKHLKVHIQIDTKMNRLGIKTMKEFKDVLNILKNNEKFDIEGLYTHFASPESMNEQLNAFKEYVALYDFPIVHCCATSTYRLTNYGNYVRCGLELYDLNQVMSIKTKPLVIKKIAKGESVGYNSEYVATHDTTIAVLPIGYGNGYRRKLEGFQIYCQNKLYQVIGRICMNHMFVEVDDDVNLQSIFELTSPNLPASRLAEYMDSSNYEVYTMFQFNEVNYIQ